MKKFSFIALFFFILSCDSDKGLNCFQAAGDIITTEFEVTNFDKITVYERMRLIVSQGLQSVVVETGENLLNDIEVVVSNGRLEIRNENGCNLVRDYGITKVYVSAPNISEIRNSSGLAVLSGNTLNFENLSLVSEDLQEEDGFHTDGDFELDLNVENLTITQNNLSNFFLSGNVTNLDLNFLFGDARFEGRELIVQNADVYHRGTNDIILNVQQQLTARLLSTGNLILVNVPPILDVEELYTGELIIED